MTTNTALRYMYSCLLGSRTHCYNVLLAQNKEHHQQGLALLTQVTRGKLHQVLRWLKNTLPYMANTVLDKLLELWNERAFLVASYYWKPARKKPAGNTHQELCIATPQTTFLVAGNGWPPIPTHTDTSQLWVRAHDISAHRHKSAVSQGTRHFSTIIACTAWLWYLTHESRPCISREQVLIVEYITPYEPVPLKEFYQQRLFKDINPAYWKHCFVFAFQSMVNNGDGAEVTVSYLYMWPVKISHMLK